jgi:hypothetical protein
MENPFARVSVAKVRGEKTSEHKGKVKKVSRKVKAKGACGYKPSKI